MSLLQLAPDIQEQILFLPRTEKGRDPIHLRQLQRMAALLDWHKQREMWQELQRRQQPICPVEVTALELTNENKEWISSK
jgi:hypothetical protein